MMNAKKAIWLIGAVFCACVLVPGAAGAGAVYVDKWAGDNGNDGSAPEKAVATIGRGVALLQSGGRLVLKPGPEPYYEALVLRRAGGTATAPTIVEGNGAVLSGLVPMPPDGWTAKEGGVFWHPERKRGARRPYLMDGERLIPAVRRGELAPGSHCWDTEGLWFIPEEGKSLRDYDLIGAIRSSGVDINNVSHVRVRDLVCERFSNDGFNVHGSSHGLVFENIVARYNGDDGFSIHEDVEATVFGGHFYGNDYGVQDVNASQSVFYNVIAEGNRLAGMDFNGGYHGVFDSIVRDNRRYQIGVKANVGAHMNFVPENPMLKGLVYIKNTEISGRDVGVKVQSGSSLVMRECRLSDLVRGVEVAREGVCHVVDTEISNCSDAEIKRDEGGVVVRTQGSLEARP